MTWLNPSRTSATFGAQTRGDVSTFGELPLSVIEAETFAGIFRGKAIDDWKFNDPVIATAWDDASRASASWNTQTRN